VAHSGAAGVQPGDGKASSMRRSSTVPRASIKIHGGHSGLTSGARQSQQAPLFGWPINLDGVRADIRGGIYSIARDGWHVVSEEVAYYLSQVVNRSN